MEKRDEASESIERSTSNTQKTIDGVALDDHRPSIRELIRDNPRAQNRLNREADAMEFDAEEVYTALERVQESYDAFEGAERRPVIDHGDNYIAYGLNGSDWYVLFGVIKQEIDDEEMQEYIARVVIKVMSDITGENWHSHNSLPLVLSEEEVRDALAYHKGAYDAP